MKYVEPAITTHGYSIVNDIPFTANVSDTLVKSCGPFVLDTFNVAEQTIKLIPNPYWNNITASSGEDAKLEELQLHYIPDINEALSKLVNDEVDIVTDEVWRLKPFTQNLNITYLNSLAGISGLILNTNILNQIEVNMLHPIIGTGELTPEGTAEAALNIRKAISHAIPRQTIIDNEFDGIGTPSISPVPDSCAGFDSSLTPYIYDIDLAKSYLELAEYTSEKASFSGYIINCI